MSGNNAAPLLRPRAKKGHEMSDAELHSYISARYAGNEECGDIVAQIMWAVAAEREACAKIADARWNPDDVTATACAVSIAAEIRSRRFDSK